MNIYQDVSELKSTVRWVKHPVSGSKCSDGVLSFDASPTAYWTKYTDIEPGKKLELLSQSTSVDLSEEFTITISLGSLPTI